MDYCTPAHPRSSVSSLYEILSSLDESQLNYLLQDLNHTTTQNMAVGQAVSAWSTADPTSSLYHARSNLERPKMDRTLSRSQKIRLSIQTIFRPSSRRTTQTITRSPAYKRISRPVFNLPPDVTIADLQQLLRAEFLNTSSNSELMPSPTTSSNASLTSPSFSGSTRRLKSYPSTINMALEREGGIESLGLGMFEPRPCTPLTPSTPKSTGMPVFVVDGESPPVLDGIFEVIGHR